ncbi:MAG: MerR family transcriptional regulator [Croceibacterium sp.]
MSRYTVKQLARLSGVSVRALHHYDQIGLLKPAFLGENRYRYYGRDELLRLQDILFHRELGVPLQDIVLLLVADGRDRLAILREHRERLAARVEHSRQLLTTIDRTIAELTGESTMDDKELYKGFSPEKQAEYEDWLVDRYGGEMRERIESGKARVAALARTGWKRSGSKRKPFSMRSARRSKPTQLPMILQSNLCWHVTARALRRCGAAPARHKLMPGLPISISTTRTFGRTWTSAAPGSPNGWPRR